MLGLSLEAKERRKKFLTASDASKVMSGAWPELYRQKMGIDQEEDLSQKLNVQIGSFTEPFGLWWYEKETGRSLDYYSDNPIAAFCWKELSGRDALSEWLASKEYPWMGCSLDARSTTAKGFPCVLDQKHVAQFRYEELVSRYLPAMTHQAVVAGVEHWALSVLIGSNKWELIEQEVDVFYAEELIAKEREFWSWVERGEEPPDMTAPAPPPKPQPRLRTLDASAEFGSDEWKRLVAQNNWLVDCANEIEHFAETENAAKVHAIAREAIKGLLPDDIGNITRHTKAGMFTAKRARGGALTMTLDRGKTK